MYKILFVDIETCGSDLLKNDMLCFGACIGNPATMQIEDTFEAYLKPANFASGTFCWEARCLREFWEHADNVAAKERILQRIKEEGVSAADAMTKFRDWINNRPQEERDKLVIYTDTAGFDIAFLDRYLSEANQPAMNYIIDGAYRPVFCSTSFHFGVAKHLPNEGLWGAEKAALKSLGSDVSRLDQNPFVADHTPLNDARHECWAIMVIHDAILKK